jgi:CheY-like chemotaxis protein
MPVATILVVDDTPEVLDITAKALEEAGYTVLRCSGSGEALAVLNDGHAIDLLLTDIAMPGGIDGFELARQARLRRPLLPVAYVTGFIQKRPDGDAVFGPILRKPYRLRDLARHVEDLLVPTEDARLVQSVAMEMMQRYGDAADRAKEAEEIDRDKGDELSAQAWHDIAEAIQMIQKSRSKTLIGLQ